MRLPYLWIAILALPLIACKKDKQPAVTLDTIKTDDYIPCISDRWDEIGYEGEYGYTQFVYNNKYYEPENDATTAGNNRTHVFDGSVWTVKTSDIPFRTDKARIVFTIGNKGYAGVYIDDEVPIRLYEYNITTNTWVRKADFPGEAKFGIASFAAGGKGYAVGGYHIEYAQNLEYPYTAQTWEYDPLLNNWTRKKSLTITRAQSVGFSVDNKGYITNGLFPVNAGYCESTLKYDPDTDEWTRVADYPGIGRTKSVSFTIGNYAYVGGGFNGSPREDFYKYNPSNNTWASVDDIPITDFNTYLRHPFSINSKGYVSYGISGTYTRGLLKYTPTTCGYVFEPTTTTGN